MSRIGLGLAAGVLVTSFCAIAAAPAHAGTAPAAIAAAPLLTYADLADLADSTPLVLRVRTRALLPVEPERTRGVRPGKGRFYVEARILDVLAGDALIGESVRYLVDLPLDARGKPPKFGKTGVLVFARPTGQRTANQTPGDIQLVAPDAQIVWDAATEARLRGVLGELRAAGAPARITGLRDALHVPGTLAGEGETQMFFATANESATSISVVHYPGQPTTWGVSFSEVLESAGGAPARETLAWYRLACFLPAELPARVNLSESDADKAQAAADYRLVRRALGECPRIRR